MQLKITARHFDLTDGIKEHINSELSKLKKYFDDVINVDVILSVEKYRNKCEIELRTMGQKIIASEETNDMYQSIDKTIDKLERNIKKLRDKIKNHKVKDNNNILKNTNEKEFLEAARENFEE